ncbi:hypothetical protein [Vibrio sp. CyArs1]|uniref:hypothetical protein n=1 Tax=Vibrio sp. CyArs1 TaxID=2682577 RepID=UPI001F065F07|nr:hypothetical protein [Vibrio sp. CyArs1]
MAQRNRKQLQEQDEFMINNHTVKVNEHGEVTILNAQKDDMSHYYDHEMAIKGYLYPAKPLKFIRLWLSGGYKTKYEAYMKVFPNASKKTAKNSSYPYFERYKDVIPLLEAEVDEDVILARKVVREILNSKDAKDSDKLTAVDRVYRSKALYNHKQEIAVEDTNLKDEYANATDEERSEMFAKAALNSGITKDMLLKAASKVGG